LGRYLAIQVRPIADAQTRVGGESDSFAVLIVDDITERKRAERALRQQTIELQTRNQELDAFAHTVAHDLKNPLNLVVGFAEVLRQYHDTMLPEDLERNVQSIVRNAFRMGNIIDELLLLSSVRTMDVEIGPIDTGCLVGEARHRLAHDIERSGAQIVLPETWPDALGYAPWIQEVWVNYMSNAIKYGGQPPRVELSARLEPEGMVRFSVRDNGFGLTSEERSRLFTPFTRLNKVPATGHGLGLSIVLRIVEKLGGRADVESEVGRGSVFSFTLPAVPS